MKSAFLSFRSAGRSLGLALALVAGLAGRAAAVSVSPTAVFIDSRSPTGTLTLYNGGSRPEEIEVSFAFGYPESDSTGALHTVLRDTAAEGEPSIIQYMRVFPRRMTLAPGQRQTLRLLVQAPAALADGEYWGRVVVRARGGQPPIEQVQGDVRAQLDVQTVVATAVLYRKGAVRSGIAVRSAKAQAAAQGVQVEFDVERQGNAVFLGRVLAELVAANGQVVGQVEDAVAVYRGLHVKYTIPLPAGAARTGYTVRYTFDTERPDLPSVGPIKAPAVTGTAPVA
jgi:P pilus assembly chaperone PapD